MQRSIVSFQLIKPKTFLQRCMSTQWNPKKRLSRAAMSELRNLNAMSPEQYSIPALSEKFHISQEAVRRILKSKFRPTHQVAQRQEENRYRAMGERQKAFRTPGTKKK
ncbi:hypothetical protein BJV82DRAFT_608289 [Fennellomyces sp. T-0311]|nr:hypothetical protein BJV82DRAFT_608289 [Fennellomyces sp. T-0311]